MCINSILFYKKIQFQPTCQKLSGVFTAQRHTLQSQSLKPTMRILSELRLSTVIITDLCICIFVGSPDIYALLYISTHICVQIFIFLFGSRLYFYVCRYIGLLAKITFDTGVRENVQKEKTSQLAASMFKEVSLASALLIMMDANCT